MEERRCPCGGRMIKISGWTGRTCRVPPEVQSILHPESEAKKLIRRGKEEDNNIVCKWIVKRGKQVVDVAFAPPLKDMVEEIRKKWGDDVRIIGPIYPGSREYTNKKVAVVEENSPKYKRFIQKVVKKFMREGMNPSEAMNKANEEWNAWLRSDYKPKRKKKWSGIPPGARFIGIGKGKKSKGKFRVYEKEGKKYYRKVK